MPSAAPFSCAAPVNTGCSTHAAGSPTRIWLGKAFPDESRGVALLRQACDHDVGVGCLNLARAYRFGWGMDVDKAAAVSLLRHACDNLDHGRSCKQLGDMHLGGDGVAKDVSVATALFRRACNLAEPAGCYGLATVFDQQAAQVGKDQGEEPAEMLAEARRLYAWSCRAGEMRACHNLGVLYLRGRGVPRDLPRSRELFRQSCEGGNDFACASWANALADGAPGLEPDLPRALSLASSTCERGEVAGCRSYAIFRFKHTRDDAGTAHDVASSCAAGAAIDCFALGFATEMGWRQAIDAARARELFTEACNRGLKAACNGSRWPAQSEL